MKGAQTILEKTQFQYPKYLTFLSGFTPAYPSPLFVFPSSQKVPLKLGVT